MALLGSGPLPRPIPRIPRTPQSPPPSMIDPSGSQYGGAGSLPQHGLLMPGHRVANAAGELGAGQPSLAHYLAAAAAAHPRRGGRVGMEQPGFLPAQAGNFAQLEPLLRAIISNPNFQQ